MNRNTSAIPGRYMYDQWWQKFSIVKDGVRTTTHKFLSEKEIWVDNPSYVDQGSAGGGVDATAYVGGVLGVGSEAMFSNKFGTWMGKDGIIRSQNWGGNGATGGKFKFAGKVSKGFKIGGWVSGAYGMYSTNTEWQNNQISTGQMMIEQGSNVLGFIPTYGTAWSIGWNLGQDFGPSTWYGKNDYKWFE
jgi:hypothetical protein